MLPASHPDADGPLLWVAVYFSLAVSQTQYKCTGVFNYGSGAFFPSLLLGSRLTLCLHCPVNGAWCPQSEAAEMIYSSCAGIVFPCCWLKTFVFVFVPCCRQMNWTFPAEFQEEGKRSRDWPKKQGQCLHCKKRKGRDGEQQK